MTTTRAQDDDIAAAIARVKQLDLEPVNVKLRHEDPELWTDDVLSETEQNYRRFLVLNLLHPDLSLSVNKTLDEYWHQHILDTRKYAADCEQVFGYFLHHYPYFGLEDEEERQENLELFALTQRLSAETFGASLVTGAPKLDLDKVLGGYQTDGDEDEEISGRRVYMFPQSCKCGQHCQKIVDPERFDPRVLPQVEPLPQEPFTPVRRSVPFER